MKFAAIPLVLLPILSGCSFSDVAMNAAVTGINRYQVESECAKHGIPGCHAVKVFAINRGEETPGADQTVLIKGKLNRKRFPKHGIILTPVEVREFFAATTGKEHPLSYAAACFYPHHGLAFFDDHNKPLGHYTICFICQGYAASIGKFVSEPDYEALRRFIGRLQWPPTPANH